MDVSKSDPLEASHKRARFLAHVLLVLAVMGLVYLMLR